MTAHKTKWILRFACMQGMKPVLTWRNVNVRVVKRVALSMLMLITLCAHGQERAVPGSAQYQRLKEQGKIVQPPVVPRQKHYPTLRDARKRLPEARLKSTDNNAKMLSVPLHETMMSTCSIEDPSHDPAYNPLPADDDGSTGEIVLPFTFNFFGTSYNSLYVNINGNVTFDAANGVYNATGFPSSFDMIAPFWADVDTRGAGSGQIYYKVESNKFTVIWHQVGYYLQKTDKRNTFKLVITDGSDPSIGIGNNVAFFYSDMQWTTGDASGGTNGFDGIPATVGMDNGQGAGACFYYQLGRFAKPGTEYIDAYIPAGVDYLDNKCFYFDVSSMETIAFDFNYTTLICAIDFVPYIHNPQNCQIYFYEWNFGDGTTSNERRPIHSYSAPGTYTVTFDVYYECGVCGMTPVSIQKQITINASEDALMDTLIQVTTDVKQEVLSTTAITFSDSWPLLQADPSLNDRHGFLNGTQGVWRNEGSHVYEVPRKLSSPPDLASDGTFSMDHFSWENAALEVIPHWIKVSSITGYSPFSYEVENMDVLGVYTAALYDYGGHLPSANGVNMRHAEMAFTGFEYLDGKASGNWIFGNQPLPQYYLYPTELSYKNIAVVKASVQELENISQVDVSGRAFFLFGHWRTKTIHNNEIICMRSHPANPDWSLVVLREALFNGLWSGEIKIRNEVVPVISPDIDTTFAHTGRSSLKITADRIFRQDLLQLDSGKSYLLSAWVSVNNPHVRAPKLSDNLGIDILVRDKQETLLATYPLTPSGSVVEGWQQVKGIFVCPAKNTYVELKFKPGTTGTAWYDDLRLHPEKGNMRTYVYDLRDYRLRAILDEENYASLFFYDQEGNLYLTQKETTDGIKTITENVGYQAPHHN